MQSISSYTSPPSSRVGDLVLDYCTTQNFQSKADQSTADELLFLNHLSTLITTTRLCQLVFGTLKPLESIPSDSVYPLLLQFCHDQSALPRVSRPLFTQQKPVYLADRLHCLGSTETSNGSVFDPTNHFAKLRGYLAFLKNYQPQNPIQLKNWLDTYSNLENFYETQCQQAQESIKKEYDECWALTQSMYSLSTYIPFLNYFATSSRSDISHYERFWAVAGKIYAVAGHFDRYEVRAFADSNKASILGGLTHFAIFDASLAEDLLSSYHRCPGFYVEIGRQQSATKPIYSEEKPTNEALSDTKRVLKISPKWHKNPMINQKIAQIMLEVSMHTERICKIYFSAPNPLMEKYFNNQKNLELLQNEIHAHPILHHSASLLGGMIPEYWSMAPRLLEVAEAITKKVTFSDEKH